MPSRYSGPVFSNTPGSAGGSAPVLPWARMNPGGGSLGAFARSLFGGSAATGSVGGHGGGGGGGGYGTGPRQHRRFPWELGNNPSQESLTRARYEEYDKRIDELHNKGAGGRVSSVMEANRANAANANAQAGLPAGSLAAIQNATNAAVDGADRAYARESEREAQLRRERAVMKGDLAKMEQTRANALFGQYATQKNLDLAAKQQASDERRSQMQLIMAAMNNPRLRDMLGL